MNEKLLKFYVLILFALCFINAQAIINNGTKSEKITEGLEYSKIILKKGPIVIHQLKLDLACETLNVSGAIANKSLGFGLQKTSQIVAEEKQMGQNIVAAVNADFFGGDIPVFQNCMIVDGEFIKGCVMSRTLLMIDKNGKYHLDNFKFNGVYIAKKDTVIINGLNTPIERNEVSILNKYYRGMPTQKDSVEYWRIKPIEDIVINTISRFKIVDRLIDPDSLSFKSHCYYLGLHTSIDKALTIEDTIDVKLSINPNVANPNLLVGGLPRLIKKGRPFANFKNKEGLSRKGFWKDRHPRTSLGIDHDNNCLYIVVVDGRQPGYSIGMSLKEMAAYLKKIGCDEAINFDGGGSSTMIVNDTIVNQPSDKTGERKVSNIIFIKKT